MMKRIWLGALLMAVLSVIAEADGACPQGGRGTVPKPFWTAAFGLAAALAVLVGLLIHETVPET